MSEVTIRPAGEEDLPAVGEVTYEAYHTDGHVPGREQSDYGNVLRDARARYEEAELLVAVDEAGAVLGTVTIARPGSKWREIGKDDELEFRMLAVSSAARGRGVGAALTRRVLARAAELGLPSVVLSSSKTMHAAHRLYERLGFHRTPDLDWSPLPTIPLITYRLDL
ncbi:GNAT family N-acetyltransferase [Actinophytocola oryzae]|uniref:L-amino acid N-acyltransferase YncA n=1 Tax=Actinophytocola oryzae TaxID=502181 RepID=A0A4R7VWS8_9PSEU|nr:GNAT family N-acetyltransferase [Actinophytocola oryzae]TDV54105.1 L-amino acid N-acyltransferase YncA [Actinophytocola oryzae]